ncbi:pantoate--beta-alanine ligase, partial [Dehalococcoidia bacterium]|nr:pantoate--beta-alanine ligase [Dehalococcoidia bacterium]
MKVFQTIGQIRKFRSGMTGSLGLVPTMGFLHEGHLSLVRQAKAENDSTVVSIFVNPTQFAPTEDFKNYPRDMRRDLELLRQERVDLVFNPEPAAIYPEAFQSSIDTGAVSKPLEGACRPGHFLGVSTIVAKLFNIVLPNRAYFGQKDGQQVLVIKRMAKDLDYPVEVVVAPTVREVDGLAMSSRNVYLSGPEREAAGALSRGLFDAQSAWEAGER